MFASSFIVGVDILPQEPSGSRQSKVMASAAVQDVGSEERIPLVSQPRSVSVSIKI